MRRNFALLVLAGLVAMPPFAGADEGRQLVTIKFALTAGERIVGCGDTLGPLGRDAVTARLRDARLYLQDIALLDAAGGRTPLRLVEGDWQNKSVALLDFGEDKGLCEGGSPETNDEVIGAVPPGDYAGISFVVGVPPALNHTSTELEGPPLDLAAMGWSWQAGRKFIRIEVDPEGGVQREAGAWSSTWFVHVGSTGCTGNPLAGSVTCERSNRLPVVFERFDADRDIVTIDLASLFGTSRLSQDLNATSGCMSNVADPECAPIFERLGLSLEHGTPVVPGTSPVFGTRPRQPAAVAPK